MKFIGGIIGLVVCFYICFLPIYIIFYNSPEDAVKDLSYESSMENFVKIGSKYAKIFSPDEEKFLRSEINKNKNIIKNKGIDIDRPLYSLLKDNKNVSDLKIIDIGKKEFGMLGQIADKINGCKFYTISWKINNRHFEIPIIVIPPSFFKIQSAIALTLDDEALAKIYGI